MRCIIRWLWYVASVAAFCAATSVWSADNFTRQDITFKSAGLNLVGWLYVPNGLKSGDKRPAIVMAHGWSAVKEMYLDAFAAKFANGGFVVTVFDYRNFGRERRDAGAQLVHEAPHEVSSPAAPSGHRSWTA